jgi:hypothetical protein
MVTRTRLVLRCTYIACLVIVTIHYNYADETVLKCVNQIKSRPETLLMNQ